MTTVKRRESINAGKDVEKRESRQFSSTLVGRKANLYNHYGKQYGDSLIS